jgi:uncharacterized protein (TIGR00369 family)
MGEFIQHNGPLYLRTQDGRFQLGFRVERRHTNPMQICHGGMMATFIDMLMPFAAIHQGKLQGRFLPTVHLSQEFLAPAPLGSWVEGTGKLLRTTKTLIFARCDVTADGQPCASGNGIFRLGPETGGVGLSRLIDQMHGGSA